LRSAKVSRNLTREDAVQIWLRRATGEAQHVLAAEYGVNPGRIAEMLSGKRFPTARAVAFGNDNAASLR
jgi:hypothetical protein